MYMSFLWPVGPSYDCFTWIFTCTCVCINLCHIHVRLVYMYVIKEVASFWGGAWSIDGCGT